MSHEPLQWYDEKADNPPWIRALAEVRMRATREGWCYQHVQAIIVKAATCCSIPLNSFLFSFQ